MARIEKTVFISYRRKDISWALAVYQYLTSQKYDVFFDYTSILSGDFEQIIVSNIKARAHFVLILTPTALDRCNEPGDWLRREIETAVDEKRNIIPLFFDGFTFASPSVREKLTGKLAAINRYNGLEVPAGYFLEAMERLSNRYLNVPLNAIIHPVSTEVRKVVKEEQIAANKALIQKWEDIKELLKPADEKSVEATQTEIETAVEPSPSGRRVRGEFQRTNLSPYGIGVGILLIVAVGIAAINVLMHKSTGNKITPIGTTQAAETRDPAEPSATSPVVSVTAESKTPIPTGTQTPEVPVSTPTTGLLSIGGADKIAFIANNDIWMMNIDGTDLKQITTDRGVQSDLQWWSDSKTISFISGKNIKTLNITTAMVEPLITFSSSAASSLDEFRVSHDGKQVMIVLNHEIFVVPFDIEKLRNVHKKSELEALNGCINPEDQTHSGYSMREALWSADDKLVAWLYQGVASGKQSEVVGVFDIQSCNPATIDLRHTFPYVGFIPSDYQDDRTIPSLDWNGHSLFVFNTFRRNNGWGELYIYDLQTFKGTRIRPINNKCCYRDARWSPDGTYLFFAFQDESLGQAGSIELYYVLYGDIGTDRNFTPLSLDQDPFTNQREGPQPALRPSQ